MFVALCGRCKKQFFSAARENLRACAECHESMEAETADLSPRHPPGAPHPRVREDLRTVAPRPFSRPPSPVVEPIDVWPARIYRPR